jgi:hypothetical protein
VDLAAAGPAVKRRGPVVYARQGGTKVHVAGNLRQPMAGDHIGRCGAVLSGEDYLAQLVPVAERCRAGACARAWPPHLRLVAGGA